MSCLIFCESKTIANLYVIFKSWQPELVKNYGNTDLKSTIRPIIILFFYLVNEHPVKISKLFIINNIFGLGNLKNS